MAKKEEEKVSVNALETILKSIQADNSASDWRGFNVVINKHISLKDMLQFVNDVVESCFQDSGEFMPELMDFTIKANILTKYANFRLPKNLTQRYDFIYGTDAVDFVTKNINNDQLVKIVEAIRRKIDYLCGSQIKQIESLIKSLSDIQKSAETAFDGLTDGDIQKFVAALSENGLSEEKIVKAYLEQTQQNSNEKVDGTDTNEPVRQD